MSNQKIYLTPEGLSKLQAEIEELKNQKRPKVVERLALARMQGDLSENAEYASAREELAFLDGRIEELEETLSNAVIVNNGKNSKDAVDLGCQVTIKIGDKQVVYSIVGELEANPAQKKISLSSPLGQALKGRKVGEEIIFDAPAGKVTYKILKIE